MKKRKGFWAEKEYGSVEQGCDKGLWAGEAGGLCMRLMAGGPV